MRILRALDERWRNVKELSAWVAYHSGTLPHMKRKPSFRQFVRCLVPRRLPSKEELGRKIDAAMYALKARFQAKRMMEEADAGRDADR